MRLIALAVGILGIAAICCGDPGADEHRALSAWSGGGPAGPAPSEPEAPADEARQTRLDARKFFQRVIDRYRRLEQYRDTTRLVQVTRRDGDEPSRVESRIVCEIADGKLQVQTPSSQAKSALGFDLPVKSAAPMRDAQLRYDLWLAPHMALKYTEAPLQQFRAGVDEGFTAVQAEAVTVEDKSMMQITLRSGDGLSEQCTATFDVFVNADSMLIERIEGQQTLPDGANFSTTLDIVPQTPSAQADEAEPATS